MAPSFSRVSSGALLLALAYNARPVNADFWEDVDNCKLVLDDLPADVTTDFCHDWTYGYQPEDEYVTVTGYPVTVTEYPDAKTCEGEGYSTTTKYPEATPEPSKGYEASKPTDFPDESTKVPDESTKVPDESTQVPDESTQVPDESTQVPDESTQVPGETTKAPDQPPATDVPGDYDVTVTSTSWTTYWTTSTIYEGYPAATPAPYRRHARDVRERAAWCVDRPCRLVQYDDDTIVEACKKYLGWEPHTSTVNVPGYTVTVTSYPTDCKQKDDGYKPESVPAYPTETYEEPYYTETPQPEYPEYPEEAPEYEPEPEPYHTEEVYPTETAEYPEYPEETAEYPEYPEETAEYPEYPEETAEYPEYPEETPEYESEPEPYYPDPAPYPEEEPEYDNGPSYEDETYENSDDKQPWEDDFSNDYSGPDGPLPWDDVDQTSELADGIEASGYDNAAEDLGLADAPWNALPVDYPQKRDYPTGDSYGNSYEEEEPEVDYVIVWVDENGDVIEPPSDDSYQQAEDTEYHEEAADYAPNIYGPDVPESGHYEVSADHEDHYEVSADHEDHSYDASPYDDSQDSYYEPQYELPESSEYEGDEFEADYNEFVDAAPDVSPDYYWGEDGLGY